jgi:hypothetical protein
LVTVNCYAPVVTKDANPYYTRSFDWYIEKSAAQTTYEVFFGESVVIDYTVTVGLEGSIDDGWGVAGNIYVYNPRLDADMTLDSLGDIAGGITAVVNCPSLVVPGRGTLTCTYDTGAQSSPDVNPFGDTNVATAAFGGGDWTGEAAIVFDGPTAFVDEAVDVTDTYAGFLGTVSYDHPLPAQFTYSRTVDSAQLECGDNIIDNTATFTAVDDDNDTGQTGSADESVLITVLCARSQLAPTNTECSDFRDNPDATENNLEYLLYQRDADSGLITNVTPGAMFYWVEVIHGGGALEVNVDQTTAFSMEIAALDVKLWDVGCVRVGDVSFTVSDGDASLTANLSAGTYYMQVRYDPKSLQGQSIGDGGTALFDFSATFNGSVSTDSLTLMPK